MASTATPRGGGTRRSERLAASRSVLILPEGRPAPSRRPRLHAPRPPPEPARHRMKTPTLLPAACLLLLAAAARGDDWPQWQGPNRDNVSKETGLLKDWTT